MASERLLDQIHAEINGKPVVANTAELNHNGSANGSSDEQERRSSSLASVFVHGDGRRTSRERRQTSKPVMVERRSGRSRRGRIDRRSINDRRTHFV